MNQATLAWSAFKNMLRAAGRDPVWAVVALITAPFRAIQPVLSGLALLGLVLVIVGIGGAFLIEAIGLGSSQAASVIHQLLFATLLVVLSFRLLTNPLILHFGDMEGETHGSARFATAKETAALARTSSGLLIGRDPKSAKLLRYEGSPQKTENKAR